MDVDDRLHRLAARKSDVMEEAAAQERVGQFLLVVRGDDDDRALSRAHRLAGFVDGEFHPLEVLEGNVWGSDNGLVDLVDQEGRSEAHTSSLQSLMRNS